MVIRRAETEYECIREGFIEGFMNAYNLAAGELMNLQDSHVNAALERIVGKTTVRDKAREHAEQHVELLKAADRGK